MTTDDVVVVDASALLAFAQGEPGSERFVRLVGVRPIMSAVNWCEVVQKVSRRGVAVRDIESARTAAGLGVVDFTATRAEHAASLWGATRQAGLSLADRACLALAEEHRSPVVTTDRAWKALDLDTEVVLLRPE